MGLDEIGSAGPGYQTAKRGEHSTFSSEHWMWELKSVGWLLVERDQKAEVGLSSEALEFIYFTEKLEMLAEHLAFKSREINKRSLKMLSFRSHLTQKNEHEVENKHTNEMYVCNGEVLESSCWSHLPADNFLNFFLTTALLTLCHLFFNPLWEGGVETLSFSDRFIIEKPLHAQNQNSLFTNFSFLLHETDTYQKL